MKGRVFFLSLLIMYECFSCRNSSNKTVDFNSPEDDFVQAAESDMLSKEMIAEVSENIPSPVEIANLLQILGVPFSPEYITSAADSEKHSTMFDKAFTLGILSADLCYLNIYKKTGSFLHVLSSIRNLTGGIGASQFFDFEVIKKLALSNSNPDSLLFLSIDSYTHIDNYLRGEGRGDLSALMIMGGWIETLYMATRAVRQYPDIRLRDRIGEQKLILNDLILLTAPYCERDTTFNNICINLQDIKDKYKDVRITFTLNDPVSVEKNEVLVITQKETSQVAMTEEQLEGIVEVINNIRNKPVLKK